MDNDTPRRVLVVDGDASRAAIVARALAHPAVAVQVTQNDDEVITALTGPACDLAIVGGVVGRRGPLVLCDALRMRHGEVPVIVLVGSETEPAQLQEHASRQLSAVQYVDLRAVATPVELGTCVRTLALAVLQTTEDPASAEAWQRDAMSPPSEPPTGEDIDLEFEAKPSTEPAEPSIAPPVEQEGAPPVEQPAEPSVEQSMRDLAEQSMQHLAEQPLAALGEEPIEHPADAPRELPPESTHPDLQVPVSAEAQAEAESFLPPEPLFGRLPDAVMDQPPEAPAESAPPREVVPETAPVERVAGGEIPDADRLRAHAMALEQQLRLTRAALEAANQRYAEDLKRMQDDVKAQEEAWLSKMERTKDVAARFRAAYEERGTNLSQRERDVAVMGAQLEEREKELTRVSEQRKNMDQALDQVRSLQGLLDTRLAGVEEFSRVVSERMARQVELLSALEQRSSKQEILTDRLLGLITPQRALGGPTGGNHLTAAQVAQRLDDSRRLTGGVPTHSWFAAARLWLAIGGVVVVAIIAGAFAGGLWGGPGGTTPTSGGVATKAEKAQPAPRLPAPSPQPTAALVPSAAEPAKVSVKAAAKPVPISDEERKTLRRKMLDAVKAKRWAEAADAGASLRGASHLDWEAEMAIADSLRRVERVDEAIVAYQDFIKHNAGNKFLDEAYFQLGTLLAQKKRVAEAREALKAVADNSKSKYRAQASRTLNELGGSSAAR